MGSFLGVDGASHVPGNLYGHVLSDPASLAAGDHEFESLGFEDCCDGHSELEVHLPCDTAASAAWRIVVTGDSSCMTCGPAPGPTCSSQEASGGECAGGICTGGDYWGQTSDATTFNLRICIDQQDDVFYQNNKLWIQYGGMYGAAGTHGGCPAEYLGKAYVNDQPWDISSLSACSSGSTCGVSATYTHPKFAVPENCATVHTQVVKNAGRGFVTLPVEPSVGNGHRGEVEIFDHPGGPGVYDVTVTLSCVGTATPPTSRLACAHSVGTGSCHQGLSPPTHIATHTKFTPNLLQRTPNLIAIMLLNLVYPWFYTTPLIFTPPQVE
jgi:hypothetical protein